MTTTAPTSVSPASIIRLGTAFCDAKAVLTAIELGLFSVLHNDGPLSEAALRERLQLHPRGSRDWLLLLLALGLLERVDGEYRNSPAATRFLVPGQPQYVGGFLARASQNLYPAWGRLTDALRTGLPQSDSDMAEMVQDPTKLRYFLGMMDTLNGELGPQLAQAFDFASYGSALDVGGARGNLMSHIVRAHPHLEGHVFDLPPMGPFFDEHMSQLGLTGKVEFHPGNFFTDALPKADVLVIGHVLHDWAPGERAAIVAKAYRSVNPGGALLVYDRMLDEDAADVENLVISLDMLLVTPGGSEYTVNECRSYLTDAGFASTTVQPLGEKDTLVIGRKSG